MRDIDTSMFCKISIEKMYQENEAVSPIQEAGWNMNNKNIAQVMLFEEVYQKKLMKRDLEKLVLL